MQTPSNSVAQLLCLAILAAAAMLLGALTYAPRYAPAVTSAERQQLAKIGDGASRPLADRIVERYKDLLMVTAVPVTNVTTQGPVSDPVENIKLSGILRHEGLPAAVFLMDVQGNQEVMIVKLGHEVVAGWRLERLDATSVVLQQGDNSKRLSIFE